MKKEGKNKKKNPNKIPVSAADMKRTRHQAIIYAWAIMFSVLRDKEGYSKEDLIRLWNEVNNMSDSIEKGYINVNDLIKTLAEEDGIKFIF